MSKILSPYFGAIDTAIAATWSGREPEEQLQQLVLEGQTLARQLVDIGDESAARLARIPKEQLAEQAPDLRLQLQWMDRAKAFLVLWRNVIFEHSKAQLLVADEVLSQAGWYQWQIEAKQQTEAAAQELADSWQQTITAPPLDREQTRELTQLQQQDSPWPVYREQLLLLEGQMGELWQQYQSLAGNGEHIKGLREVVLATIHDCLREIQEHKALAKEGAAFIGEHKKESQAKVPAFIQQLEAQIHRKKHSKTFSPALEKKLVELATDTRVPVATMGMSIQVKEINFKRYLSRWLDSEVLPLLYEFWEVTTNVRNNLRMAFINIRNRAILLNNESADTPDTGLRSDDLAQPLQSFILQTRDREKELEQLHQLIHQRMDGHFQLTSVFRTNELFLSAPLQSTLNQFRTNQNELTERAKRWWKLQRKRFKRWRSAVQEEEAMSLSEKIVRYVESRLPKPENQAYTSIFLTKGYIGESFWVGRKSELKRIATLIEQWRKGYRGAVFLTGNRFSGKSLLGDLISNNHFPNNTVRLMPNSSLSYQGRTFETTYDLGEALDFVSKYTRSQAPLIWLDDLELWHDTTCSISQNVDKLKQHIDRYSGRIFYQVATNKALYQQLDKSHALSKHFQATITLDSMSQEEIRKAILIRHGATHKELVDAQGEKLSPPLFQQLINRVYRASNGNIGEALNLWAYATQVIDSDQVRQKTDGLHVLPNFADSDQAILLRTLIFEKRSTEYRLRKRFGPAFQTRYGQILQRLLSVGIIERHIDNSLEISEAAVNDVHQQLINKAYL